MWLALSDGWLSIVAHRDKPDHLLVRARNKNHIESYFPNADMYVNGDADYPFRADVLRTDVTFIIADYIQNIAYPNYKNSVDDDELRKSLMGVWAEMAHYGDKYRPVRNTTHNNEEFSSWGY